MMILDRGSTLKSSCFEALVASLQQSLRAGRANARAWIVIASGAKQSILPRKERVDCFAPLAMTAEKSLAWRLELLIWDREKRRCQMSAYTSRTLPSGSRKALQSPFIRLPTLPLQQEVP